MGLLLTMLFCLGAAARAAENHALLIGIGTYPIKPLDGPPNDVAAFRNLLIGKYAYKPELVHTLVNQQATKQGILTAVRQLAEEVKPGDYVIFYYSGHGTSAYDPRNKLKDAIGQETGANLPVDFNGSSLEAFRKSILLGSELRPYFTQMDAKAQVLAIYDSCFSQDSMKALARGAEKYVPLSQAISGVAKGDLDDAEQSAVTQSAANDSNEPLPYRHLIAISAAKRDQAARDIGGDDLKRNRNATFDHQAHGQLTNALLMGLNGAADKNHDGVITHEELFYYLNEVSAGQWSHNPKLRVSADAQALRSPAISGKAVVLNEACSQGEWRQSRISAPADILRELGGRFQAVADGWDVKVVPQDSGYVLHNAGGVPMNAKPFSRPQTLARLRQEGVIEQLSEMRYCKQGFNVELAIEPDHGKYVRSQTIQFAAKVDKPAYLLVIDIDQEGGITVNYPLVQATRLPAGQTIPLGKPNNITEPFGVDLMKAFAFENKPAGFDEFVARVGEEVHLLPGDPRITKLLNMLTDDGPGRAETRVQLVTSEN